jgi:hypothetical protein
MGELFIWMGVNSPVPIGTYSSTSKGAIFLTATKKSAEDLSALEYISFYFSQILGMSSFMVKRSLLKTIVVLLAASCLSLRAPAVPSRRVSLELAVQRDPLRMPTSTPMVPYKVCVSCVL